ncbi:MAG: zinc-ribbon domain-containing protein [Candidatus Kariarchaeaceae archaeon]|jgi:hypothetical protein
MYCPDCGTKNAGDARFCLNCGLDLISKEANSSQKESMYARPQSFGEPMQGERTHSSIIDHLPDAATTDYDDKISSTYYILAFFWPMGIFLWAFYRPRKPNSAKNLLASAIAGFLFMFLIL